MASKKLSISNKQSSMVNFLHRNNSPNENMSDKGTEKKGKFVWKSKTSTLHSPSTFTPPFKQLPSENNIVENTRPQSLSPSSMSSLSSSKLESKDNLKKNKNLHNKSSISMDIDDVPEARLHLRNNSETSPDRSKSIRISETPTPPKTINSSPVKKKLITPEKTNQTKDRDPLKNLKLDSSISDFLSNIAARSFLEEKDVFTTNEIDECKIMYMELLEKISDAFHRIPNCIKEKFPGYDKRTYSKIHCLKTKLKSILNKKAKRINDVNSTLSPNQTINRCDVGNASHSILDHDDLDDFDLPATDINSNKHIDKMNNLETSTPELTFSDEPKGKTIYDIPAKKSLSFDVFSPLNNTTELNSNIQFDGENVDTPDSNAKIKGKFIFKRPSVGSNKSTPIRDVPSNTLEKLKQASEKLQPLKPEEKSNFVPLQNSSVAFQPQLGKSVVMNKPCTVVSPFVEDNKSDDFDFEDAIRVDMDEETDINQGSIVNISDSTPSTSKIEEIPIDEDGWPEYRFEDFEDVDVATNKEPPTQEVNELNLMDHTVNEGTNKYEGIGDFHAGTKNDGTTGEFDGFDYPHSALMMEMFKEKFGLKSFRPNQLQVINATLLGHDCFVLMPTGGGKSLCYQLPAILTPGVTIVISPLKSLILDQVNKLLSLDIPAAHLSGDVSLSAADEIYHKLSMREPALKLLYVTPEKVSGSPKFQSMLENLYSRGKIARFVIDEAHCVSQWGHDFRPDYKRLSVLRHQFPATALMALTATATPRVRMDILHQLKVTNCKWFLCSFNRPNLSYRILEKKPKSINDDVAKLIKEKFFNDSGIVYCLSRRECETLELDLRKVGIRAAAYHAGLTDKKREAVQSAWVADKHQVICATIAFGMGIDKADVRYVIHHSLPKSVEGYYQEAGRAGRDGKPAACLLFYNYSDVVRYRRLMDMDKTAVGEARRVHEENLLRMVELCESVADCRRAHVLAYLGERYDRKLCRQNAQTACDNCLSIAEYKPVDVTEQCKMIVRCVRSASGYTLLHIAEVLRGSMQQRLRQLQNAPIHGCCKSWSRGDPQRLLRQLVVRGLLAERLVVNNDIATAYLTLGPNVDKLMSGNLRVVFPMKSERKPSLVTTVGPTTSVDKPINALIKKIEDRCYADLVEACREMGSARGVSLNAVLPQAALRAAAARLPERPDELLALPHVTRANYDKYGAELLRITSAYALEKMGLLMQYQDELEEEQGRDDDFEQGSESGSDTDWSQVAREASSSRSTPAHRGRGRGRAPHRGGVRKRFKRRGTSAAKKKAARGALAARARGAAGGNKLGSMPMPRANTRPGVFNPSKLNL